MNGVYIRQLSTEELTRRLLPFLSDGFGVPKDELAHGPTLRALVPAIQERLKKLSDVIEMVDFAFQEPGEYDPQELVGRKMTAAQSLEALRAAREALAGLPEFAEGALEAALRELADRIGVKAGSLFGILRTAVTGKQVAPPLFASIVAVGWERTLARCDKAIGLLEGLSGGVLR
jgi:glutamyl-tRNA synthetase